MKRQTMSAGAGVLALTLMSLPVEAVTVDIDVQTEGEPVPVTQISFLTPEGEEISEIELVEVPKEEAPPKDEPVAEDQPKQPAEAAPPAQTAEQDETPAQPSGDDAPNPSFTVNVPDKLIGKQFVIMLRQDDKVIKKEPISVTQDTISIPIEAYDPADARLALDFSQPAICRRGQDCAYELAITNDGDGIYSGPLFLTGQLYGTIATPDPESDDWSCQYAGRGKQVCYAYNSLQPGESRTWSLSARLPRRLSQNTSNCLEISLRNEESSGRSDPLVQSIQIGLSSYGIRSGRPDGIMGSKTQGAIDQFTSQPGLNPAAPLEDVFIELFGMRPDRLARLGLAKAKDCEKLALVPPPKKKKRISKSKSRRKRTYDRDDNNNAARDEAIDRTIGIGIGLGALGERRHRRKKHKRYEQQWED